MDLNKRTLDAAREAVPKASAATEPLLGGKLKTPEFIALKSCHGKYLSAQPNGTADWSSDRRGKPANIQLVDAGNGKYGLKSVYSKYLSAQPDGRAEWNRDRLDLWETWELEAHGEAVALKSFRGKYLSAQPNGRVEANRDAAKQWEIFVIEG